jgi:hypothetical protein
MTRMSLPWLSHPMVWGCGYDVVGRDESIENLYWYEVLLVTAINDKAQQVTLHPHMWMEKVLTFLWLIWFTGMDLGGSNGSIGFCINYPCPPFWFWLRVEARIWFRYFHLGHQRLLQATINDVMLGALMEVTPLPGIFLCLSGVLVFLQPGLVVLRLSVFALSFIPQVGVALSWILLWGVPRPKLLLLLFELLLDFDSILVGHAQGWYVQKIHFGLDVSMQTVTILEHQMSLRIFDTHLGAQGMEYICELMHRLVSFLLQHGPFCVQVVITSKRVVLFLNSIRNGLPSEYNCK